MSIKSFKLKVKFMNDYIVSKPQIKQKNTWLGLGSFGFGLYSLISGDLQTGITGVISGLGLIFSHGM